jgi:hypothetical protein
MVSNKSGVFFAVDSMAVSMSSIRAKKMRVAPFALRYLKPADVTLLTRIQTLVVSG